MDASAALNAASQATPARNGNGSSQASDPLQRLEAELEATAEPSASADGAQPVGAKPEGAQLYEEAQRLLEEAWSIFTECQVMRDGLLVACQEIERTMDTIQHRLGGAPIATESNGSGHLANGKVNAPSSTGPNSNDTGHSSNGNGHSANVAHPDSNGNGDSANVAHPDPNGNGNSANGGSPDSNGNGNSANVAHAGSNGNGNSANGGSPH